MTRLRGKGARPAAQPGRGTRGRADAPKASLAAQDLKGELQKAPPIESLGLAPWLAWALAALFALAPFIPALPRLASDYLGSPLADMEMQHRTYLSYAFDEAVHGRIPLWNPFVYCGTAYLPSTQGTLFYPISWPCFFLLSRALAVNVEILVHVVGLALGCLAWARYRGATPEAALLAAMAASGGSTILERVFAGHFTIVCALAWAPWLFLLQERVMAGRRREWLLLALAVAASLLAGHAQISYYAALLMAMNFALRAVAARGGAYPGGIVGWLRAQLPLQVGAAMLGVALAALEVFPLVFEVSPSSARTSSYEHGEAWYQLYSIPPLGYLTMLMPKLFGWGSDYHGPWLWWETCHYAGLLPTALAVAGGWACVRGTAEPWGAAVNDARAARRGSGKWPLAILALACLVLAGFSFAPGGWRLLALIPGWSNFRGHAKIMGYGTIFVAVLAAEGFDHLRAIGLRGGSAILGRMAGGFFVAASLVVAILAALAPSGWLALVGAAEATADERGKMVRAAVDASTLGLAMGVGCLVVLWPAVVERLGRRGWHALVAGCLVADLLAFSWRVGSTSFPKNFGGLPDKELAALRKLGEAGRVAVLPEDLENASFASRLESPLGYDLNISRAYNTYASLLTNSDRSELHTFLMPEGDSVALDLANLGAIAVSRQSAPMSAPNLEEVPGDFPRHRIYRRRSAFPRAFVVPAAQWVANDEDAVLKALKEKGDFASSVLLVERKGIEKPADAGASARMDGVAPAAVAVKRGDGYEARVGPTPTAGWLVLADGYDSRWKASTVDGKPLDIYRANGAFRAVRVEAGQTVMFRFSSPAFAWGLAVSAAALASVAVLGAWPLVAGRRRGAGRIQPAGEA